MGPWPPILLPYNFSHYDLLKTNWISQNDPLKNILDHVTALLQ